jgi:hypothetical protein
MKPSGEPWALLFFWTSSLENLHRHSLVLRPLSQFLGAFSQGQMPTHTGMVWSWDFCLSSLDFSHKARCQLKQARSHCWLRYSPTKLSIFIFYGEKFFQWFTSTLKCSFSNTTLGLVVYTCNPSTKEVETWESRVWGQSELYEVDKDNMR